MGDFLRVSQFAALVAGEKAPNLRVTQVAVEALCTQPPGNNLRVTQLVVEVLGDVPAFSFNVAATTSITIGATAGGTTAFIFSVEASTSLEISASSFGYVPADIFVLAVTGLGIAGSGGGEGRTPGDVEIDASSDFTVSPSAAARVAFVRQVSAMTTISLGVVAYSPIARSVSAVTTILISDVPVGKSSSVYVSASSNFKLSGKGSESAILFINVEATTSFALSDSAKYLLRGGKLVSASTSLGLSSVAAQTKSIAASVSGVTGLSISAASSESAEIGVSGSSGLAMLVSGKQNRDLYVSASISLGIGSGSVTRNLKNVSAASTITLTVSASVELSGTVASSSFILLDLAQAVVWVPWRRSGLSLEPGGNLPHS